MTSNLKDLLSEDLTVKQLVAVIDESLSIRERVYAMTPDKEINDLVSGYGLDKVLDLLVSYCENNPVDSRYLSAITLARDALSKK